MFLFLLQLFVISGQMQIFCHVTKKIDNKKKTKNVTFKCDCPVYLCKCLICKQHEVQSVSYSSAYISFWLLVFYIKCNFSMSTSNL